MHNSYESKYYEMKGKNTRALFTSAASTILIVALGLFLIVYLIILGGSWAVAEDYRDHIQSALSHNYDTYEGLHNKGPVSKGDYSWTVDYIKCKSGKEFRKVELNYHEDYLSETTLTGLPDCE